MAKPNENPPNKPGVDTDDDDDDITLRVSYTSEDQCGERTFSQKLLGTNQCFAVIRTFDVQSAGEGGGNTIKTVVGRFGSQAAASAFVDKQTELDDERGIKPISHEETDAIEAQKKILAHRRAEEATGAGAEATPELSQRAADVTAESPEGAGVSGLIATAEAARDVGEQGVGYTAPIQSIIGRALSRKGGG